MKKASPITDFLSHNSHIISDLSSLTHLIDDGTKRYCRKHILLSPSLFVTSRIYCTSFHRFSSVGTVLTVSPTKGRVDSYSRSQPVVYREDSGIHHDFALSTMEHLFSPCTRFMGLDREGRFGRPTFTERNLDVSTEVFLSAESAFTYTDLHTMMGDETTAVWLTRHAPVVRNSMTYWGQRRCFFFSADGKDIEALTDSRSPGPLLEICDIVLRLLAASNIHSVSLDKCHCFDIAMINAVSLANLLEQCQSLTSLTLIDQTLDENHCLALGEYSRPGLEIVLSCCKLTNAGTSALAEVLGRNQGPTKLVYCHTDHSVLADGLRGNSRLKRLRPHGFSNPEVRKQEVLAIAGALKENRGLVGLDLSTRYFGENDETWGAICDSLKTHPTLEVLNLSSALTPATNTPEVITSRIQALLDMMKMNLSIHTIRLKDVHSRNELFRGLVIPYLETNRLRPRLLAIQKTRPIPYRDKVLGRALLSARSDANRFWMLFSGNAEVAFPSTISTATLAANLARPATTVAASNSSVTAAVAALSPTAGATSTISVSAVDSVATPTVVRKHKSLP
jgi:hypothetical protein